MSDTVHDNSRPASRLKDSKQPGRSAASHSATAGRKRIRLARRTRRTAEPAGATERSGQNRPGDPAAIAAAPDLSSALHAARILETMSDGFQSFDREWRYTYLNNKAEQILGRKREELLGKVCWQEYPEAVGTPFYDYYVRVMTTREPFVFEDFCPHRENWVEFSLHPLPDGGVAAYTRDITERKRAEQAVIEAVKESEARQRAFLRDVLASATEGRLHLCLSEADLPEHRESCAGPITLSARTLKDLRRAMREAARAEGLDAERSGCLESGVGEAAMNAVVHGGGGEGMVCRGGDGVVQVWITDRGKGISVDHLPRATLLRGYSSAGTLGHGFYLMLQSVDRLWLLTGPEGTTIVLEQDREAAAAHDHYGRR